MQAEIKLFKVRKSEGTAERKYSEFRNVRRVSELIADETVCWVEVESKCVKQLSAGNYSEYFAGFANHEFEAIVIEIGQNYMVGITSAPLPLSIAP
jgi:hypothetical protein